MIMNYDYKKGWWETKNHQKIKIKDMETSHIQNTINLLKRKPNFYDDCYFAGWTCDGDGDGQIYEYIDNSYLVDKKIEELEFELRLRKLERVNEE